MIKIAIYGKGGIGKSTTASNLSAAFAAMGKRVMQIGCDPKADSTTLLHGGTPRKNRSGSDPGEGENHRAGRDDYPGLRRRLLRGGRRPTPGMGCAGRGIIAALETLEEKEAFSILQPDIVLYDVLGDVVCGGFAMPIREGYARKVFVVTSGENMAIHAAANIAMAVENFKSRGYASLGGIILNRRGVPREQEKVEELAADTGSRIVGALHWS